LISANHKSFDNSKQQFDFEPLAENIADRFIISLIFEIFFIGALPLENVRS